MIETKVVNSNVRQQNWAPIYGLIIVLAALGAGVFLIMRGYDSGGLAAIITALSAPVAVFVTGQVRQFVERRDKDKRN